MRGCLLVIVALAGCRGFFDVPPVSPDAAQGADAPPVPVGYLQSAAAGATLLQTLNVNLPLAAHDGNTNVLVIGWSGGTIMSINDPKNTYVAATGQLQAADGWTQQIYIATGILAGSDSVTVSFSGQEYIHLGLFEYTGIAGIDPAGAIGAIGTANDRPETPALTTTNAHDLLFASLTAQNAIRTTLINGYTTRLAAAEYLMADQEVTTRGAYPAMTVAATQGDWVMQLLPLRAQ